MLLNGRKGGYVGKFIPSKEREELGDKLFTNVYVKNFTEEFDDDKLKDYFEPYGRITSCKVMAKEDGKSKGFGFVAFETTEAAEAAVQALNGKDIGEGKSLYVARAQKKAERQKELKRKFEQLKKDRQHHDCMFCVNLYVKNLDDSIDDERLRKEFSLYGTISSAKVMTDEEGRSKGFGFVCFISANEATCALTELNGRVVGGKPLYVALVQRKKERRAHLATQVGPPVAVPPSVHACVPPAAAAGGFQRPSNYKYPANMRNPSVHRMQQAQPLSQQLQGGNQEKPIALLLANAQPQEQKQILGERLYPIIECMLVRLASKITGVLLEIENSELLHMLEDQEALKVKVEEAVALL